MWFLFFQIWIWLLAAFILGWCAHWFYSNSGQTKPSDDISSTTAAPLAKEVTSENLKEEKQPSEA